MQENCNLIESKSIKNGSLLAKIIYDHFIHLRQFPELNHSIDDIKKLLKGEKFFGLFLYSSRNKLIGYLVGELMNLHDGRMVYYISYFYIVNEYRSNGIGKRFMNALTKKCVDEWGIKFIVLTCENENIKACQFYRKLGFVRDSVLPPPPGNTIYCLYI